MDDVDEWTVEEIFDNMTSAFDRELNELGRYASRLFERPYLLTSMKEYSELMQKALSQKPVAESYSTHNLFEGKALTPEEKMDRWHKGARKENIKACALEKLKEYRKICRAKGYTEEVKQINAEINRRKKEGINESYLYEGVLSSYTEFSEPSKDKINDTITMLKKCRSNLDSVMYNFDRDLPDDVYTEMRQVYGNICSAMDLLPDYF